MTNREREISINTFVHFSLAHTKDRKQYKRGVKESLTGFNEDKDILLAVSVIDKGKGIFIDNLIIGRKLRGQGYGRFILQCLKCYCHEQKIEYIKLEAWPLRNCSVMASDILNLVQWYLGNGFYLSNAVKYYNAIKIYLYKEIPIEYWRIQKATTMQWNNRHSL